MERTDEDVFDEWLVLRWQAGDLDAAKSLVARWQKRLWCYARRLTNSDDGANESVQEAWMAAVRGLGRLGDPSRFRAWMYRIVSRKAADWIRSQQRRRRVVDSVQEREPSAEPMVAAGRPELESVREALLRLTPDQRQLLILHHVEGLGLNEIAEVIGVPVGTVKSRLFHARSKLKVIIETEESENEYG